MADSKKVMRFRRKLKIYQRRFTRRSDSEHEQALIRLVIVFLVLLYTLIACYRDKQVDSREFAAIGLVAVYLVFSMSVILGIAIKPDKSPVRRIIGMLGDLSSTTYLMYLLEGTGAALFVVLLWVPFGNGFRFGRSYLFISALVSTSLFFLLVLLSPYWNSQPVLCGGLLVSLVALPAYVSVLLKKLQEAISRAEEASRVKSQFLANMSHEMRTPLTGIMGMAELMADPSLNPEQSDFVKTIHASACTMLALVEDVLDISKIEAGKLTIEKIDFDLHALVKSTAAMVAPQAQEKGLRLTTRFSPEVPFLLSGDPLHMRQVLLNLVGNAIKFTNEGEVCIRVRLEKETDTNVMIKFEVCDTGIGIAPEVQARIFNRFTQADESITRRYGGTGLGTTIAKELVELMGGEIGLTSEVGVGSTFWFTLEMEKQLSADTGAGALSENRVLLVSPDSVEMETIQGHLSSWGISPLAVDRAGQAFAHLVSASNRGEAFHIAIVVDRDLDMDPLEFAKAVKADDTINRVQLILAGAYEKEPEWDKLAKDGFDSAVRIPVDKTMLFNAIHFVRPDETDGTGITRLANRYMKKLEDRQGLRILVAEDNLTNQKVIAKILERKGHRTCLVENGEQALDAMEKQPFDLLMLDLNMPVMGGLEAAKIYRFMHGREENRVPIIALTADATPESRKACQEVGIDAYVTKPIDTRKLLDLIENLVNVEIRKGATVATGYGPPPEEILTSGDEVRPAIDPVTFRELEVLGGNSGFIDELIQVFLKTSEQTVRGIESAVAALNAQETRDRAHALRGNAGQIGAVVLAEKCSKFSRIETAELRSQGPGYVKDLKEEFSRVREALRQRSDNKPGCAIL